MQQVAHQHALDRKVQKLAMADELAVLLQNGVHAAAYGAKAQNGDLGGFHASSGEV